MKALVFFSFFLIGTIFSEKCKFFELRNNLFPDFWEKCFENEKPCGEQGFALAYGVKYLKNYISIKRPDNLPNTGIKWLTKTFLCLKEYSYPTYEKQNSLTCEQINYNLYKILPTCFSNSESCLLFLNDDEFKKIIIHTLKVFEKNNFTSARSFKELYGVAEKCGGGIYTTKLNNLILWLFPQPTLRFLENESLNEVERESLN
jgi:hypothetical protein